LDKDKIVVLDIQKGSLPQPTDVNGSLKVMCHPWEGDTNFQQKKNLVSNENPSMTINRDT